MFSCTAIHVVNIMDKVRYTIHNKYNIASHGKEQHHAFDNILKEREVL